MATPFSSLNAATTSLRARLLSWRRTAADTEQMSWIREGTEVHGSVTAVAGSAVLVEGVLHGDVLGGGIVYVAAAGRVRGSIQAEEVVVAGEIHGDIQAKSRCEVHSTGLVIGSVHASACLFLEGARVAGVFRIGQVEERLVPVVQAFPSPVNNTGARATAAPSPAKAYRMALEP